MTDNYCVSCGNITLEGRNICWACENGYTPDKRENNKEKEND